MCERARASEPRERSGVRGAPRGSVSGSPRGEAPRILMNRVRFAQREGCDLRVELLAVARDHLIGPFHDPEWRVERAARRICERFARSQDRLLADDARSLDLLDVPGTVG